MTAVTPYRVTSLTTANIVTVSIVLNVRLTVRNVMSHYVLDVLINVPHVKSQLVKTVLLNARIAKSVFAWIA